MGRTQKRPELAKAIDAWASDKAGTHVYKALTKRYFELGKQPVTTELPEVKNGHVSPYDELFRKHAKNIGWDWQLLASIGTRNPVSIRTSSHGPAQKG